MAWIDEGNCRWVIETKEDLSADIKRAALHHHPKLIIPMMLRAASTDNRPLNAFPNADMRLLEDWVTGGEDADAVRRRRIMFDAATNWVKTGGDTSTGVAALSFVFNLKCHKSDSDPADPSIAHSRTIGYPIWARDLTPVTGKWRIETVEINGPIEIGAVRVAPGDLVVADDTGVCFIPRDVVLEVLDTAEQKAKAEAVRCKAIDDGVPVPDISRATYGDKS